MPGFLDAAKRGHLVRDDAFVDADDSVLQSFTNAPDTADVPGIEIAGESKFRIVRHLDCFFLGLEFEQWRYRAKNFFTEHAHVIPDLRQYCRLDEAAAKIRALPAGNDLGAFGHCIFDELEHVIGRTLVDQRTDRHPVFHTIAHLQVNRCGHQLLCEFVVDAFLHKNSIGAHTSLARIAKFANHCACDSGIEIRVVKHDEWCIAAELHRCSLNRCRTIGHEFLAYLRRSRERQLPYDRIGSHFRTDFRGPASNDIDNAGRYTCPLGQLRDSECG